MKIWHEHGSEHSANLVMIGHFKDATKAMKAKGIIDALTAQVAKDQESGALVPGIPPDRYGKEMLDLLLQLDVASVGPGELEQLAYEVNVKVEGEKLIVTTDELDISAFLKILFLQGARIELYSAHNHPDAGRGRGQ